MKEQKRFLAKEKGEITDVVIGVKQCEKLLAKLGDARAVRKLQEAKLANQCAVSLEEASKRDREKQAHR
jgi:hypothetical protein